MEHISDIVATLLTTEGLFAQVFSMEDPDGTQYHFNATHGMRLARESGNLCIISLSESGITPDAVRENYTGLNEAYAMTTDLTQPILFVPHRGKHLCIDGHHRLFKAAVLGQDDMPAYFLTEEQTESIKILTLPPEHGIDWGQKVKAS